MEAGEHENTPEARRARFGHRRFQRGRFLILTAADARLYWLLMRLLPGFSRFIIDRIMPLPPAGVTP